LPHRKAKAGAIAQGCVRRFETLPVADLIFQTPSEKSSSSAESSIAPIAARFPLPWSVYVRLLAVKNVFGRRLRPSLSFFVELRPREGDDPHEELHFFILNEGRGLARHLGFFVQPTDAKVEGVRGLGLANATAANPSPTVRSRLM